jgi:hypothetical protein
VTFGEQFNIFIRNVDPWDSTVNVSQWIRTTESILHKIDGVKSGRILFQAIFKSGVVVAVEPLNWQECNAHGAGRGSVLNGKNFNAVVKFDATVYTKGSHCFRTHLAEKYKRGGLTDEVMFHEFTHALRGGMQIAGAKIDINREPLSGGMWRYSTGEEFFAVLLTNIYISDLTNKASSGLRAGHRGKTPLESYFSHSLCFFASSTQVLPLLKQFQAEHKDLFEALAEVKATFNPIRMMVKNPEAVERMSKAKATAAHEKGAEKHQRWLEEKRLKEVRASIQKQKAIDAKDMEDLINSIANATPEQIAEQLGRLGKYTLGVIKGAP